MLQKLLSKNIRSALLLIAFVMLCVAPAMATPVVYTDRAAFDAAAGSYTLLTLGAPSQIVVDYPSSSYIATYNDLITFGFDLQGGVDPPLSGGVLMGRSGLIAQATVLQPVTAFGFDVAPGLNSHAFFMNSIYPLTGLNFLGFVSASPFTAQLESIPTPPDPFASVFFIDNIAIQAVPEPAMWLLLTVGGFVLVWVRWRTSGLTL
jgi:hypothetical protein